MFDTVRIGSVIAEQINQWKLHAALKRHTSGGDQRQRVLQCRSFETGFENHPRHLDNVVRKFAMPDWILSRELQQGWIPKVVSALEDDALMRQFRILL